MAPYGPPHRAWRPAAARTAKARRSTIASRRGEQRGASRQSGVDPSLSPTRTCLSHSEVACKRAAGAGEREGWQKLPLAAVAGRRARGTSRRGEQRGASRQSGADPSLSTTRTCLSRSEVACKRAAGAGEREGWAKLRFVPFCPFSADFSSAVWRRTDHAAHGCVHTGGQHHLTAAICVAAPPEPRKPGAATALRRCGVAAAACEARCVKSPSTAPARCHRAQGWR